MTQSKSILIYSTFADQSSAEKAASDLLKKRLVACAVFWPIKSMYWWKGALESSPEVVLLAKTTQKQSVKARAHLANIHPYETPCILEINNTANAPYLNWMEQEITPKLKRK